MYRYATPLVCLLFIGPVQAQSVGEKTGVNSVLGISPKTEDFVNEAAVSDMFEIKSSELALTKAPDDATKAFADKMIADHKKTSSELKVLVESGKVSAPLPTQMDAAHEKMLDKLKGLDAGDFAKSYHDDQAKGHKDAVSLFKRYAEGGENADLKAWANKTLPDLEHHQEMADKLDQ